MIGLDVRIRDQYLGTSLKLSWFSFELRELCEKRQVAERQLGDEFARILRTRLADFCAAENVTQLVVGNLRELNESELIFEIDLDQDRTIQFKPNHAKLRSVAKNLIEREQITRIMITSVSKRGF